MSRCTDRSLVVIMKDDGLARFDIYDKHILISY